MSLPRSIVRLLPAFTFLFLSAIDASPADLPCDSTHAQPSVASWPVALEDTVDFGLHVIGFFQDGEAIVHNAGYGDLLPGHDVVLWAGETVTLLGNICAEGHVHANDNIENPEHFRDDCEQTWSSGTAVCPPPVFTEPDSFPGATYYYVEANDGPGNADTLFIKDRDWNTLGFYIKGVTVPDRPSPDFTWAYDSSNGGVLSVSTSPTAVFDQVSGPFPRTGNDLSVVINFGGLSSYMKHARTDLVMRETGLFVVQSTIINARFNGTTLQHRLDPFHWTGGRIEFRIKTNWQPTLGLALIAGTIIGNAQIALGTPSAPALAYCVGSMDLSVGQWDIHGAAWSLGDIWIGGGVTATFASIPALPAWLQPCARELEVTSATFSGPDAARFSVAGGFQPFLVGNDPVALPIHFSDSLAYIGTEYQASLVLTTRDAPGTPNGTNLEDLTWLLKAKTRGQASDAGNDPVPPARIRILRSAPNPFTAATQIYFEAPVAGPATLTIYDTLGRRVVNLLDAPVPAGRHEVRWNGEDASGRTMPGGTYFARLTMNQGSVTRKLLRTSPE